MCIGVPTPTRPVQPPVKGILKRRAPKKKLTTLQKITKSMKDPLLRLARPMLKACGLLKGPHITFKPSVKTVEYSRRLDGGDTVPGDDTIVCLGLGEVVARREVPLAKPPPKRPPIEDRAWVQEAERIKLLRKAMGDKRFFVQWQQHRRSTRKIRSERKVSKANPVDFEYMPVSMEEAKDRAARNARESKHTRGEMKSWHCAHKLAWKTGEGVTCKKVRPTIVKSPSKRVKAAPSAKLTFGIVPRHVPTPCHVCLLPISAGCQCCL